MLLIVYSGIILYLSPTVMVYRCEWPIYIIFISILPILSLYFLCLKFSKIDNKFVSFIESCGLSSLVLLGLHNPIWQLTVYPLDVILGISDSSLLSICLRMITAIPISLFLAKWLMRKAPYLIGNRKYNYSTSPKILAKT